ncbi:polysaccharide pyruvyl transferase family protein [Bradyrhizobium canariense]|uniref:Polysaccharide pyruvyl transferase family protein WcaK n=1 Tax=Bradyrhizobium canariense TaxID=255045 RepID=A0A1H1WRU0_9BRAD|nr:polysaccharide pyruvyl transferase family protein [Bradyrhizobium canariense]SDS99853.1 Polysaccharide pyruvyl transferase family protein WcaK [Bradyrhizobium canariense]
MIERDSPQIKSDATGPRVALFGNFGTGNLGNEATLQAMVLNVRKYLPNAEISCICPKPENTAKQYDICAVPIRAPSPIWRSDRERKVGDGSISKATTGPHRWMTAVLNKSLRIFSYPFVDAYRWFKGFIALKDNDLLIMTGTGMVGDYAIGPFDLHYDIFRWAVIARLCRCKLLFVSVGGGPLRHPLSRWFIRAALALADYGSYRDAPSKDHLAAVGIDVTNHAVYPDLAFSLPKAVIPAKREPERRETTVGVGIMNYHTRLGGSGSDQTIYRDYIARIASLVVRLLERGYTVRILIGDVVWDQDVRGDLRKELEERRCNYDDGKIIDEPALSVDELLLQLASVDVVVSSRFHNVLLGLMLGKPAMAISYHEKFQPLMSGVGLGEFYCDIERIDVDELIGKVVELVEDAPAIEARLALKTESYRAALDEQYRRIFEGISSYRGEPSGMGLPSASRR